MKPALVVAATAAALALPTTAAAHVVFAPPFVQDGREALVSLQVPNERPPHATVELIASAPRGIAIVLANAPPGWRATVRGQHRDMARRPDQRSADADVPDPGRRAGPGRHVRLQTAQGYDDGATVRWKVDLSVLPATGAAAPKQHPWGAVAAALAGIVVIAGSLVGVRASPPEATSRAIAGPGATVGA